MKAIRAHINGSIIVPDQPLELSQNGHAIVLLDSDDIASQTQLAEAVQRYYEDQSAPNNGSDDLDWARATERGSTNAWDEA